MIAEGATTELAPRALTIEVSRREVHRYLGYRRRRQPRERVARQIEALWPLCEALSQPHGAGRIISREQALRVGMQKATEWVGVGLVTIGPALEAELERRKAAQDLLSALILDAFGSAAAESAADALNLALCRVGRRTGWYSGRRVSPGYGRWAIEQQSALLAILPAAELGVELTPGLMMIPRKSVSFGLPFSRQAAQEEVDKCGRCRLSRCPYRRVTSDLDEVSSEESGR